METTERPHESETFHPVPPARRGEAYAWGSLALLLLGMAFWRALSGTNPPWLYWLLTGFFGFAALSISLGNWMERRTVLRLEPDGVFFTNGVRRVFLPWEDITEIRVRTDNLGRRVEVWGGSAHFAFRTLSHMSTGGKNQLSFGFVEGENILARLVSTAGLSRQETSGQEVYYRRQPSP